MENFLNLNTLVEGDDYRLERKMIWIYLWLLIFEGALRKWILPGLQQPLLLVREPIVIFLVCRALMRGWIKEKLVTVMIFVSTLSLISSLLWGHQSIFVGFFGWRLYFFHFPFMYVMGKVLTRDDLMKMIRFILILSIPMTILIVMQFYSPQTAWVNRGIGGDTEGAGFGGAMGYFRPPGTFSFTSGYVCYQGVVGATLIYYLVFNNSLKEKYQFPTWLLAVMAGCYLVSIPTSISRTHMFQTCVFVAFVALASMRSDYLKSKFFKFAIICAFAIVLVGMSGLADTQIEAFTSRMDDANKSEGGLTDGVLGDRYFGSFVRGLVTAFDFPFWGYGIGLGTNAGAKLMGGNMYAFGFNGEEEWSRITGECGLVLGWGIIIIRVIFSLNVFKRAYSILIKEYDLLPWMLSCGVLLTIPQGNWGIPTNLGFCMLFGGFALAVINTVGDEDEEENDDDSPCYDVL